MALRQKWEGFENRMKAKREINCKRKQQATPKKVDHLTVQRLSSDVSGKAQKFSRIGPREFVSYPLSFTIYLEIVLSMKSTNQKHGGFDVTVSLFSWGHPLTTAHA